MPLSAAAGAALRDYSWLRQAATSASELENVIHYALIVCAGDEIHPEHDLKLVPLLPGLERRAAAPAHDAAPAYGGYRSPGAGDEPVPSRVAQPVAAPVPDTGRSRLAAQFAELLREGGDGLFDAVERALVHAAFEHAQRNQVRSAKALGVTRNMVRTLLKRHGLLATGTSEGDADAGDGEALEDDVAPALAGDRIALSAV